ncbi:FtsX-like permease family protein [Chitinispirillales bacterium ANBcel5]|uniref:ABC transporter permease n=1 Tax=Cellulosispirillum alkaliphilum TaxID=3039283 RepID=UPI002A56EEF6|nr:FtsX-like permease family protein [Chitinispirillales bacterium ANBcel5]
MMLFVTMAWRNLWRNSHRTLITTASIFFAVILVLFIRSMQLGTYEHMITNTVRISTGFIQVQGEEFWETRSLENSMQYRQEMVEEVMALEDVTHVVPRIESFALASSGDQTRASVVTGIDPEAENRMNNLEEQLIEGTYLSGGSSERVLIASGLAEYLNVSPEDTVILLGQGYYGMSAAGAFLVEGIVDLPLPDLNQSMLYMSLEDAQWFYSMPQRITSLAVMIDRPDRLWSVRDQIWGIYGNDIDVLTWREMLPELVQIIELDDAQGLIMLGILYLVIAFGVFGTVMMMMAERRREFAIMVAIGLKNRALSLILLIETVVIGLLGTLSGIVVSVPILLYMRANPIVLTGDTAQAMRQFGFDPLIPFLVSPSIFINQGIVVMVISLVACLYPVLSVRKLNISDQLHG